MAKFGREGKKEVPAFTTSSMSDIVFMLLFFFMVTTNMRETETKVMVTLPEASEDAKLERKDLASYIIVGAPAKYLRQQYVRSPRSQLNDYFRTT